ncbi:MAG: U32 family peptidase [Clostridia bacterium]
MNKLPQYSNCELLCPAGDKLAFFSAINNGADAIYLGLTQFSARQKATNFDIDNLDYYLCYAHNLGVKIYITLNTLIKDTEVSQYLELARQAYQKGVDAFIVQDIFLAKEIAKLCPNISLHLSTQGGTCNVEGAKLAKAMGFNRIIVARETPIEELALMTKIIDTEVFTQGALCSSISGQCLFSSVVGGNSGNRGLCKQPCRQLYSLDNSPPNYALSLADLSVGEDIEKFANIGVKSFKIEGRLRGVDYVASSAKYYSCIMRGLDAKQAYLDMQSCYCRGEYTKGLAFGQNKDLFAHLSQGHIGREIGLVSKVGNFCVISTKEKFKTNDCFKLLRQGKESGTGVFLQQTNDLIIKYNGDIKFGDSVRLIKTTLCPSLTKKIDITCVIDFEINKQSKVSLSYGDTIITVEGQILEQAQNQQLTELSLSTCFSKTQDYPFNPKIVIEKLDNVFMPTSKLNELRRLAYLTLFEKLGNVNKAERLKEIAPTQNLNLIEMGKLNTILSSLTAVIDDEFEGYDNYDIAVYFPNNYKDKDKLAKFINNTCGKQRYLYLPNFLTSKDIAVIEKIIDNFEGIFVQGYYGIELSKRLGKQLFCGFGYNIFNTISAKYLKESAKYISLSNELNLEESQKIKDAVSDAFIQNIGSLEIMQFAYCPLGKDCVNCAKNEFHTLIDKDKRINILRRYEISQCRFTLYNCSNLLYRQNGNRIVNLVGIEKSLKAKVISCLDSPAQLTNIMGSYTRGHSNKGVQ